MFLSERIDEAIERATVLHGDQKRKLSGAPYIAHPYAVAFLLAHYSDDEDVIIAGLLHDTLEDVPEYTYEMLRDEFGERVAHIVQEVTEDLSIEEQGDDSLRRFTWKERKDKYLANLKDDSQEALLVAAADKVHNLRSMLSGYMDGGEEAMRGFHARPDMLLWFYGEVTKTIAERVPDHPLTKELVKTYEALADKLGAQRLF